MVTTAKSLPIASDEEVTKWEEEGFMPTRDMLSISRPEIQRLVSRLRKAEETRTLLLVRLREIGVKACELDAIVVGSLTNISVEIERIYGS